MEGANLGVYVAASLALIVTPGQDMIYVVTRSLAQGRLAGVLSAAGVCTGILVHTAVVALGIGALLQASETLFLVLKLAGAAYLVYLGLKLLLRRESVTLDGAAAPRLSAASLFAQGVVSNVTNPKIVVFFLAFLPQFVSAADPHPTRHLVFLGVLYAAMGFAVKAAVGVTAGSLSERLLRSDRALAWMNRVSGTILVALGLRLAAAER
jgi:threonine/homoserine/homoserine lactone efflux protein